ncbi:MAG TPA: BON domain-containing protein [Candidatus Angelobacter sp.]|nr:BON domain-containing protein [Candidatus Angelobacter sp.]
MKNPWYVLVPALAIAFTLAAASRAQSAPSQQQNAPTQTTPPPITSSTPSNQVGTGSQTQSGTPAPNPQPAPAMQNPAQPETELPATPAMNNADLQMQIQTALQKEPTLASDNVNVAIADDTITLTGNVASSKEKQTATRIAQSYAGNKKVVSHLTISGHGSDPAKPGSTPDHDKPQR